MNNLPFAFEEIKKYIEQTSECGTVPSLSGFVRQNTDLVVRSPLKRADVSSLDSSWKKRFMTAAEILNAKINIDAPDWNSIIEMKYEERIKAKRRINTYLMYENENEIIGNQLSKNQENHPASHKSNLKNEEFTTIDEKGINVVQKGPSPEIVNYDVLVSKSIAFDDGYQTPPHQITSNTYINEISIDENILRVSAQSLAKLDESKYFGDFIPHFIKYKESQKKDPFSCTNDDIMDIRGESGFSKFLSVDDYIKLRSKNPKRKVEVPEVWRNIIDEYFKETTDDGTIKSISDWINITKKLNILNENDSEDVIKIKEYLYRVMIPLIESFAKPVPDISAPNTSEHHYWAEFGHRFFSRALQELVGLDWRTMGVLVHASKYRKNFGHKHIDKVVDDKSADLLAWTEKTGEEIFVGQQAGPPTKSDLTKLATDSFKLYREMRDCLNFRILRAMGKGDMNYNNRIVFGVLGYLFEIKMLMMWKDGVYIYDEYGSLNIASKLNLISDMKAGIIRLLEFMMIIRTEVKNNVTVEYDNDSIQILKRKFDEIAQTKPSPNKVAKR